MNLFNLDDVLQIEQEVLAIIPANPLQNDYFKEDVAIYLYDKWVTDPNDTRILLYSLPLIQYLMIEKRELLKMSKLGVCEIFSILCIDAMKALEDYDIAKGTIYTWLNKIIRFRISDIIKREQPKMVVPKKVKDLPKSDNDSKKVLIEVMQFNEEWDALQDYEAINEFQDFLVFLRKMKKGQGKTSNSIIDALLSVLINEPQLASISQARIIERVSTLTKLPTILISIYYAKLLERYKHSVLD